MTQRQPQVTRDQTPQSVFVSNNGVKLHVADWGGTGTPLILVHGTRRTSRSWDAVARRLKDSFRILALDVRGHGDSDAPVDGYKRWEAVEDVAAIARDLKLGPHFIMGHSIGGATSALYAARYADRVLGALLIEPVPDAPKHYVRVGIFNEDWTVRREGERRNGWASMDDLRKRLSENPQTRAWTPEVLEDVLKGEAIALPDGRVEMKWHRNAYNLDEMRNDHFALIDDAPTMTMPVMVMASVNNNLLHTHLEPLVRALPRAELVALPGVGHNIYMEAPDVVADHARRFFARD